MADAPPHSVLLLGCGSLTKESRRQGIRVHGFSSVERLLARGQALRPRACVVHPDGFGDHGVGEVLSALRSRLPFTDVLVWAPDAGAALVREAMQAGARDVVLTPDRDALASTVAKVIGEQQLLPRIMETETAVRDSWKFEGLVSRSRRMWDLFDLCLRTAATDAPVLVLGESGTGKELVARAIHERSGREGRFVALNCGAVPETLIDSELFGHTRGAFTGANRRREGLFRHADGGTLFLDEIGDIALPVQSRLLRALQEGTIRPVGGHQEVAVDVRVIAATSSDLELAVQESAFREDLLYRLDVIRLLIPPLRERPEDILFLFGYFMHRLAEHYGVDRPEVSEGFLDALTDYPWPGNVRQLENFSERLLLTGTKQKLGASDFSRLTRPLDGTAPPPPRTEEATVDAEAAVDLEEPLEAAVERAVSRTEREYLHAALRATRGRVGEAARAAGISRRTLFRKMKSYGIDKGDYRSASPT